MPIYRFALYGLQLEANIQIPGLLPPLNPEEADVHVHLKEPGGFPELISSGIPDYLFISPNNDETGHPVVRVARFGDSAYFVFFYSDGARFVVDKQGNEIWADWPNENYTVADAATYLIGPVIGFVLRLRGALLLHASVVAIGDQSVALMGGPGAGKSTTAAEFARLGHAILSDDMATLREVGGKFLIQPGYPRVNLWPDSVRNLFGSEDSLPHICPTWDKRFMALDQDGMKFEQRTLPLSAIYILGKREAKLPRPVIEEMEGASAFMNLVTNTYGNYLLDGEMRRHEFNALSRLLATITVRVVTPSSDPGCLRDMCELIAADAKKLLSLPSVSAHAVRG